MFKHLNLALIGGGAFILAFTTVAGVIWSAQDGVFLGRKLNTNALALRSILGPASIIPSKSGFCIAQYLVMFVVYLGISIANHIWLPIASDKGPNTVPKEIPAGQASLGNALKSQVGQLYWSQMLSSWPGAAKSGTSQNPWTCNNSTGVCFFAQNVSDKQYQTPIDAGWWNSALPLSFTKAPKDKTKTAPCVQNKDKKDKDKEIFRVKMEIIFRALPSHFDHF